MEKEHRTAWGQEFDARRETQARLDEALAINATIRGENERLKKQVNDQAQEIERLRRLGIAAAEGMKATAKDGLELCSKYDQLKAERDALAREVDEANDLIGQLRTELEFVKTGTLP